MALGEVQLMRPQTVVAIPVRDEEKGIGNCRVLWHGRGPSPIIWSCAPAGDVLLVNYIEPTDDPQSGDSAASLFIAATVPPLRIRYQKREDHYRIDLLSWQPRRLSNTAGYG
jgi:hypothetical protein